MKVLFIGGPEHLNVRTIESDDPVILIAVRSVHVKDATLYEDPDQWTIAYIPVAEYYKTYRTQRNEVQLYEFKGMRQ